MYSSQRFVMYNSVKSAVDCIYHSVPYIAGQQWKKKMGGVFGLWESVVIRRKMVRGWNIVCHQRLGLEKNTQCCWSGGEKIPSNSNQLGGKWKKKDPEHVLPVGLLSVLCLSQTRHRTWSRFLLINKRTSYLFLKLGTHYKCNRGVE